MKAIYFDGTKGEKSSVPTRFLPKCRPKPRRLAKHMLEALSMYSDEMMELLLSEEEVPDELVHNIIRDATINQGFHARLSGHRL